MRATDTVLSAATSEPRAATLPQALAHFELATAYSQLHRRLKLPFNPALNRQLQSSDLSLNLDLLPSREGGVLSSLLAGLRPSSVIRLWSHAFESQARVYYGLPASPPLDKDQKVWSKVAKTMEKAAMGLAVNIGKNVFLTQIFLFDLVLTQTACTALNKGFRSAQLIETVSLVNCRLTSGCKFFRQAWGSCSSPSVISLACTLLSSAKTASIPQAAT